MSLWLKVTAEAKNGGDITVKLEPVFSVDGGEEQAVPGDAVSEFTVTLGIGGTEYARILSGESYLTAAAGDGGITFTAPGSGSYTVIPDARLVTVTFHLRQM